MSFHLNGFGTGFVGRNTPGADGTYVITEWVMIMFIPIYPIKSVRVLGRGNLTGIPFIYMTREHRYVPVPLDRAHVRRVYTGLGVTALIIGGLIWWGSMGPQHGP